MGNQTEAGETLSSQREKVDLTILTPENIRPGDDVRIKTKSGTTYFLRRSTKNDSITSGEAGRVLVQRENLNDPYEPAMIAVKHPQKPEETPFKAEVGKPFQYSSVYKLSDTEAQNNTSTEITQIILFRAK